MFGSDKVSSANKESTNIDSSNSVKKFFFINGIVLVKQQITKKRNKNHPVMQIQSCIFFALRYFSHEISDAGFFKMTSFTVDANRGSILSCFNLLLHLLNCGKILTRIHQHVSAPAFHQLCYHIIRNMAIIHYSFRKILPNFDRIICL